VTTLVLAEDDGMPAGPAGEGRPFLDRLVAQLSAQYGVDPLAVRNRAVEVLASFSGARVQAFVPVLVEKRVRETFRRGSGRGVIPAARAESEAV
jgi:hypothetical protein